ncbi:MAG TPA: hypothetical protein VLJ57_06430, partial [Burkholderiaceae bacterium]|nr:hypothetical protein [Burkholderiaceae bacterium]
MLPEVRLGLAAAKRLLAALLLGAVLAGCGGGGGSTAPLDSSPSTPVTQDPGTAPVADGGSSSPPGATPDS